MVGIKICGVKEIETIQLCADLQVDWVGFVFYPPSPRFLELEQARVLEGFYGNTNGRCLPKRVGLFVNPQDADIQKVLDVMQLDILQVYGSAERVLQIQKKCGLPVWQSCGVSSCDDLPTVKTGSGYVIEAKAQADDAMPGGVGRRFNWALTRHWVAPDFWMLAGGLTPDNVLDAITRSAAPAVDVSSGVEERKGLKSHALIKKFVKNARDALAKEKAIQ